MKDKGVLMFFFSAAAQGGQSFVITIIKHWLLMAMWQMVDVLFYSLKGFLSRSLGNK